MTRVWISSACATIGAISNRIGWVTADLSGRTGTATAGGMATGDDKRCFPVGSRRQGRDVRGERSAPSKPVILTRHIVEPGGSFRHTFCVSRLSFTERRNVRIVTSLRLIHGLGRCPCSSVAGAGGGGSQSVPLCPRSLEPGRDSVCGMPVQGGGRDPPLPDGGTALPCRQSCIFLSLF